jgi:hypothetical protein
MATAAASSITTAATTMMQAQWCRAASAPMSACRCTRGRTPFTACHAALRGCARTGATMLSLAVRTIALHTCSWANALQIASLPCRCTGPSSTHAQACKLTCGPSRSADCWLLVQAPTNLIMAPRTILPARLCTRHTHQSQVRLWVLRAACACAPSVPAVQGCESQAARACCSRAVVLRMQPGWHAKLAARWVPKQRLCVSASCQHHLPAAHSACRAPFSMRPAASHRVPSPLRLFQRARVPTLALAVQATTLWTT